MITNKIDVTGLEALSNKLKALGDDVGGMVDKGLRKGAMKIQGDAKRNITAAKAVDTGRLRNSIVVEPYTHGISALDRSAGYVVGTNVEYAPYIEFGTGCDPRHSVDNSVPHTTKKMWRYKDANGNWHTTTGMSARPFLRPAFRANKTYIAKAVRDELLSAFKKHF